MTEVWVVSPEHGQMIVQISYLLIPTTFLHAIYCQRYFLSVWEFAGFLSSVLYWRKPTYGLRRNIDICIIQIAIFTHLYFAWVNDVWYRYVSILSFGLLLYPISHVLQYNGYLRESMICHCVLHCVAFLSSNTLYYSTCLA